MGTMKKPNLFRNINKERMHRNIPRKTRMLKVKGNYKGMHNDKECRICGEKEETLEHILGPRRMYRPHGENNNTRNI
jgi:hypothetical protein